MNPIGWISSFISRASRVLRVSYRPTREEFYMTLKITGLGIIGVGVAGFIISMIFNFIEK
jgi:protein transport protein SEC61 subunit gamma-like protein